MSISSQRSLRRCYWRCVGSEPWEVKRSLSGRSKAEEAYEQMRKMQMCGASKDWERPEDVWNIQDGWSLRWREWVENDRNGTETSGEGQKVYEAGSDTIWLKHKPKLTPHWKKEVQEFRNSPATWSPQSFWKVTQRVRKTCQAEWTEGYIKVTVASPGQSSRGQSRTKGWGGSTCISALSKGS